MRFDQTSLLAILLVVIFGLLAWQAFPAHYDSGDNLLGALWRWTTHDPVAFFTAVLAISTSGL